MSSLRLTLLTARRCKDMQVQSKFRHKTTMEEMAKSQSRRTYKCDRGQDEKTFTLLRGRLALLRWLGCTRCTVPAWQSWRPSTQLQCLNMLRSTCRSQLGHKRAEAEATRQQNIARGGGMEIDAPLRRSMADRGIHGAGVAHTQHLRACIRHATAPRAEPGVRWARLHPAASTVPSLLYRMSLH